MANQIEIRNRIREIVKGLEDGHSTSFIISGCMAEWGISRRTVERYIAVAAEMVNQKLDEEDALIRKMRNKVVTEEAEAQLRSNTELEAYLMSIIEGDMETRSEIIHSTGAKTIIKTKPSRREVLQAVNLLWQKRGMLHTKPEEKHTHSFIMVRNREEEEVVKLMFKNMEDMGPEAADPKQFEPYTIEGTGGLIDGTKLISGQTGVPPTNPDIATEGDIK